MAGSTPSSNKVGDRYLPPEQETGHTSLCTVIPGFDPPTSSLSTTAALAAPCAWKFGGLPGYPESHGCSHLPSEFARRLFDVSPNDMTVVIGTDATAPVGVTHPGYLAPVDLADGLPVETAPFGGAQEESWHPESSPNGPVSIVLSQGSRLIVVYRNGIEIGRVRLVVIGLAPLTNHALVPAAGPSGVSDPYVPDPTKFHWLRIGVPGHLGESGTEVDPMAVARLRIPADFVARVNAILSPGTTLFVTSDTLYPQTSGSRLEVVDADPR